MKKNKTIYWTTTGIISLMMLFSAFNYFTNTEMKEAFLHLGFPDYFRIELGFAKALGAIVLLLPMVSYRLKEFTYAGFTITLISACIAHVSSGDPIAISAVPMVILGILTVSYIYYNKINSQGNNAAFKTIE
jgi:VIT1/CCC1 family predicted Fe2+/Mn2+ transporter